PHDKFPLMPIALAGNPQRRGKIELGGATALRRATGTLQYFPYTDLTRRRKTQKIGRVGLPLAPTCPAISCVREGTCPEDLPWAERDPSIRTPASCLRLSYCPAGVRRPCQASRTWW